MNGWAILPMVKLGQAGSIYLFNFYILEIFSLIFWLGLFIKLYLNPTPIDLFINSCIVFIDFIVSVLVVVDLELKPVDLQLIQTLVFMLFSLSDLGKSSS